MKARSSGIDESSSGRCREDEFDSAWPSWQEGLEPRRLLSVQVQATFDALFRALFQTHSRFQSKAQDARRYTNLQETNWTADVSDLPTSRGFQWSQSLPPLDEKSPQEGMLRKVLFSCPGNAMHPGAFRTEQVERCVELVPGRSCVVDVCVLSSPMYCDRFRPIVRYTMERASEKILSLTVDYQIIYVSKVNFVLKGFIERSARGGMEESFRKWRETLEGFFQGAVVDMTAPSATASKQQRPSEPQSRRPELKSHRLEDVPLEFAEEDMDGHWNGVYRRSESIALLLLAILLPILRLVWLLVSLPSQVMTSLANAMRKAYALCTSKLAAQALLILLLSAAVFDLSARPHSLISTSLESATCSPSGAFLCFSLSFAANVFLHRLIKF